MIVVAGEALIDLIVGADGGLGPSREAGRTTPLGRSRASGSRVTFLGRISTDRFGRRPARRAWHATASPRMASSRPTSRRRWPSPSSTRTASATYRFYVAGTSAAGLTDADAAGRHGRRGRSAARRDAGPGRSSRSADRSSALVERSDPARLVMVDPNCRPSATTDPATFRARIDRIAARADVVKVSDDDLRFLAPGQRAGRDDRAAADLGARVVLRTHGTEDVEIRTRLGPGDRAGPRVDVVDTVGAGDAFGGGFLASWIAAGRGRDDLASMDFLCDAVRVAVRVAALSCTRPGADPPTLAELEAFPG